MMKNLAVLMASSAILGGCSGDTDEIPETTEKEKPTKTVEEETATAEKESALDTNCSVERMDDGSTLVRCLGSDDVTIPADTSCTFQDSGDGTGTVSCPGEDDSQVVTELGEACSIEDNGNGTAMISCPGEEPLLVITDPGFQVVVRSTDLAAGVFTHTVDLSRTPKRLDLETQCGGERCSSASRDIEYSLMRGETRLASREALAFATNDFICLGEGAEGDDVEFSFPFVDDEQDSWIDFINPAVRDADIADCPLIGRVRGHNEDFENGQTGYSFQESGGTAEVVEDPDDSSNHTLRLYSSGSCDDVEAYTLLSIPLSDQRLALTFDMKGTREATKGEPSYGYLWLNVQDEEDFPGREDPFQAELPTSSWETQTVCLSESYQGRVVRVRMLGTSLDFTGGSCANGLEVDYYVDNLAIVEAPGVCDP